MNILYINHYAGGPAWGMEFRPYYLAREWVRAGHQVSILAASYSHVRTKQPDLNGKTATSEWVDGIRYQWYKTSDYQGNGLGRVINISGFLWAVFRDVKRLIKEYRPDVVIASSTYPMDIWIAHYLARKANAKLVFEVHDLWPLSPIEIGGMSPQHPFIRLCQAAENFAYRKADLVISMLPKITSHALSKGLPEERLVIIPNGISLAEWNTNISLFVREDIHNAIRQAKKNNETIVMYAGSHGLPNALDNLLNAACILRNNSVRFILVGDGHEKSRLQSRLLDERLDKVHMFEPIPKIQIPAFLALADMAYLGAPQHPLYRFGVSPNKLTDYMMASVPVLYAIDAGNDPVSAAECGITVPAENAISLANAISKLSNLSKDKLNEIGNNGYQYALSHHTYEALAPLFINTIENTPFRL